MNNETLNKFSQALVLHRDALLEWLNTDSPQKNIRLGGAEVKDVLQVVSEIKNALERIDNGEFGRCTNCGDDIETERLELDCTTQVCLDHYSEAQINALERDLELAAKVQRQLMPYKVPTLSGIQIAVKIEPAQIVGGDYFDFFSYQDGSQGMAIADVMGKGLSASMLMSNLQASLRILGPNHKELHTLAIRLNELFRYNLKLISFITIFLARIDIKANILHYCNAGHNPAIWLEAASGSMSWLKPTGPAIGLTQNAKFESEKLQFSSGDLLLLYTDGLIEARNSQGEEFGEKRLSNYIKDNHNKSANVILKRLLDTARSFAGKFHDDVTLLVIKIQ